MIVERTQEGKKIARKNKDYKEGRPKKFSKEQIRHAMQLLEDHSVGQVSRMTGISQRTLFREKARLAAPSRRRHDAPIDFIKTKAQLPALSAGS